MYNVYPLDKEINSELIDLREFVKNNPVRSLCGAIPFKQKQNKKYREQNIRKLMNIDISNSDYQKLQAYCSPAKLSSISMVPENFEWNRKTYKPEQITEDSLKLNTIKELHKRLQTKPGVPREYFKYHNIITPSDKFVEPSYPPDLSPGEELVIRIKLYEPFIYDHHIKDHKVPKFSYDVIVLGSQTLDMFREKIICPGDWSCLKDMSDDPELDSAVYSKDVYKSGFFFIEDTFYNDTRDHRNIDYSKCIINWAQTRKEIGKLKTAIMENTRFNELKIHLGYPQVYQHRGKCEHIFIFADVEILQPADICHSVKYPYSKMITLKKGCYCIICGMFMAKWYVKDNERVPFNPSYFCDTCFKSYNYKDGKKIGNFKAYPYFDRANVV